MVQYYYDDQVDGYRQATRSYTSRVLRAAVNAGPTAVQFILDYLKNLSALFSVKMNPLVVDMYMDAVSSNRFEILQILQPYYDVDLDTGLEFRYYKAMREGDLKMIQYFHPVMERMIGPAGEVTAAIESGSQKFIDYFKQLHPGIFLDRQFMNDLVGQFIEEGSLDHLRTLVQVGGNLIDYDRAARMAGHMNDPIIEEYFLGLLRR